MRINFSMTLDLENWNGTDRFHFNAIVSDQDLIEVYTCVYMVIMHVRMYTYIHVNERCRRKEERSKPRHTNNKEQTNTAHSRQSLF